jgi:hypothetical protein
VLPLLFCLPPLQALQPPDVIAAEIAQNLEAALEQAGEIYEDLMLSTTE